MLGQASAIGSGVSFPPIADTRLMNEPARMRTVVVSALIFTATAGCAPQNHAAATQVVGVPNGTDFVWAMEAALPDQVDGKQVILGHCRRVQRLKCSPMLGSNRSQCTYQYGEGQSGIA